MNNEWTVGTIVVIAGVFMVFILLCVIVVDRINKSTDSTNNHAPVRHRYSEEENRRIVEYTSKWYKQVQKINGETKWHTDILDNGHSECYLFVETKAQFDRADYQGRVEEFLITHRDRIVRDRELIRENWDINEVYQQKLKALSSEITPEQCDLMNISYEEYTKIERNLIELSQLQIITGYGITCKVIYISPHGRKHYEKERYYDDFDIDYEFSRIDRVEELSYSEENRRKVERSKLTPSLRYDVLHRDGFSCCICGRNAGNGIQLEVDHIIPISKGGETTYENLQTLCRECNRGKGAKL